MIHISKLSLRQIDYLVATLEGYVIERPQDLQMVKKHPYYGQVRILVGTQLQELKPHEYSPTTNWDTAGKIMVANRICYYDGAGLGHEYQWMARKVVNHNYVFEQTGDTILVACMKTFIDSKLGSELSLPEYVL